MSAGRSRGLDADYDLSGRLREYAVANWGEEWREASIDAIDRRLANLPAEGGDDAILEVGPSLDNCELSSTAGAVPDLSESGLSGVELGSVESDARRVALGMAGVDAGDVGKVTEAVVGGGDRLTAIYAATDRDAGRQEKVVELLARDEVGKAKRLALCRRRSVQLECPDELGAGGCGSDDNYVPMRCGLRICPDCATAMKAEKVERYKPVVRGMENPMFATFTVQNVEDFERGVDFIVDSFGRLRQRTIPFEGEVTRTTDDGERVTKRWCWWEGTRPEDFESGGEQWKIRLREEGADDLIRRLQDKYVYAEWQDVTGTRRGKQIPFNELVSGGVHAVDIKSEEADDGDGFNVHLHAVMDAAYIPQAALSVVWEDLTGAPVVDVRRVYDRSESGIANALMETVGYALKQPEFESVEEEVDYLLSMEDRRMVNPFGSLFGSIPDVVTHLVCSNCGCIPRWWNYGGVVQGEYDNMGVVHGPESHPPPGSCVPVSEEVIG